MSAHVSSNDIRCLHNAVMQTSDKMSQIMTSSASPSLLQVSDAVHDPSH